MFPTQSTAQTWPQRIWNSNGEFLFPLPIFYHLIGTKNTISYEEAEDVATAALILDPKFLKARYRRGLARKEQNLLKGAMTGSRAF